MDWGALLQSVLMAAALTALVSLIASIVSSRTALKISEERLILDKKLADQKAKLEHKISALRVKLELEIDLAKKRASIAETVLTNFYKAKRAFDIIRSPMIWAEENIAEEGVAEDVIKDPGYGVIRRLRQYSDLFSEIEASRYSFSAMFGSKASAQYDALIVVHNRVFAAAKGLLENRHAVDDKNHERYLRDMRRIAFSMVALDSDGKEIPDRIADDIEQIVASIESICRPHLEDPFADRKIYKFISDM